LELRASNEDDTVRQVPYADHQIVFPASYFRYHQKPTAMARLVLPTVDALASLPAWLAFSIRNDSEYDESVDSIHLPLGALVIATFALGRLDALLETVVARHIFAQCSACVTKADGSKDVDVAQLLLLLEERHPELSHAEPSTALKRLYSLHAERQARAWSAEHVKSFVSQWLASYRQEAQQAQHLVKLQEDVEFCLVCLVVSVRACVRACVLTAL
jgi:hypothetical protein